MALARSTTGKRMVSCTCLRHWYAFSSDIPRNSKAERLVRPVLGHEARAAPPLLASRNAAAIRMPALTCTEHGMPHSPHHK